MALIDDFHDSAGGNSAEFIKEGFWEKAGVVSESLRPCTVVYRHGVCEGSVTIEDKSVEICFGQNRTPWGLVWHSDEARISVREMQNKTPMPAKGLQFLKVNRI